MDKITILVSTVDRKVLENKRLLDLSLSEKLQMVIVNQMINDKSPLLLNKHYCKVINDQGKGLSRSRNLALNEVNSGFAIIADDDVEYVKGFNIIIKESFKGNNDCGVLTFRIKTPEGEFFKEYSNKEFIHSKKTLLKVSSIDMVLNMNILENCLRFDERFGLGSDFDTGENNIFLFDAYSKFKLKYVPETIVIHPFENSGRVLDKNHFFSKGAVFKRMFGMFGLPIAMLFCFKKRKEAQLQDVNIISSILYSLKGFFKYQR